MTAKRQPLAKRRHGHEKRLRFAAEYLIDFDSSKAAVRAGYSTKFAKQRGYKLMQEPEVVAEINRLQEKVVHRAEVTAERVLREVARIAFCDITEVVTWADGSISITDSAAIPPDVRACISEITETRTKDGGTRIKVKLHDKGAALDKLMRKYGLFKEDNEQGGKAMAEFLKSLNGGTTSPPGTRV